VFFTREITYQVLINILRQLAIIDINDETKISTNGETEIEIQTRAKHGPLSVDNVDSMHKGKGRE
jgi:hypothetical protein